MSVTPLGFTFGILILVFCSAAVLVVWLIDTRRNLSAASEKLRHRQRELDTLAGMFAEEAARTAAPAVLNEPEGEAAIGDSARLDATSGLLVEPYLDVVLDQKVAVARRKLLPVSLALFELDGLATAEAETREQAMGVLGEVVRRTMRECDAACRLSDVRVAVIFDDTTESGAVWAAERMRARLWNSPVGNALTVSAGIASYPTHALDAEALEARAAEALESAQAQGCDRVEVARTE
jgi:diguanylate cyclase (GGDEF)-like protein